MKRKTPLTERSRSQGQDKTHSAQTYIKRFCFFLLVVKFGDFKTGEEVRRISRIVQRELSTYFAFSRVTPNTFNERDIRKYHAFFMHKNEVNLLYNLKTKK